MDQRVYMETIAETFKVDTTSVLPALVDKNATLSKQDSPQSPEELENMRNIPYREAVGALMMWASTMTRPDIASAVLSVAKFCDNAGQAVLKVLQ